MQGSHSVQADAWNHIHWRLWFLEQETLFETNDGDGIPVPSVVDAVTTNGFVYDILWLW